MGVLILLVILLSGLLFTPRTMIRKVKNIFPYLFVIGSLFSIPIVYIVRSYVLQSNEYAIIAWILMIISGCFLIKNKINILINSKKSFLFFTIISILFYYLFKRSFSYSDASFLIASNLYADFGVHIPFIRSFSSGQNFPFEVPFFGGGNVTYHFLFDLYTGILESFGVRIDSAYNLLFTLTLSSLFFFSVDFANNLFKNQWIGVTAFFLFLLPSDLSFVNVYSTFRDSVFSVWHLNTYMTNSFLGERTVGNFLYFNTYLNQRHLLFALAVTLGITNLILISQKKYNTFHYVFLGVAIGLLPLWNFSVFAMFVLFIFTYFIIIKTYRQLMILLVFCMLVSFPQIIFILLTTNNSIHFTPGFLMHDKLTVYNFLVFWFINLGIGIFTMIAGFLLAKKQAKVIAIGVLPIFLVANIFQFAKDIFDNHKFFNFWFLFMSFFSAFLLFYLWKKKSYFRFLSISIFFTLTVSGITQLLVVKNDVYATIYDYKDSQFIKNANMLMPLESTILTNGEIYDPLSVTGRKTYLGRTHHVYSYGGDPVSRENALHVLFTSQNEREIEHILKKENINYIVIYKNELVKNKKDVTNNILDKVIHKIYEDDFGIIYKK